MVHLLVIWRTLARGAFACLLLSAAIASAQTYSKATKVGSVKGLDAIGCKGGFTDIKGACWKCPPDYKHDDIFKAPTDPKVCKDEGGRDKKKADRRDKATGALPAGALTNTICPSGQWVSRVDEVNWCWKCDSGYTHDHTKFGNETGVCWRDKPDRYAAAQRMQGNVLCDKDAYPDPIDGGTCWTCPASAPTRNFTERVDSAKACVSANCGKDGGRPCLLTERVPSCDAGLVEDIVKNQCVTEAVAFAVCTATVNSLKAGKVPAQLQPFVGEVTQKTKAVTPVQLEKYKKDALAFVEANKGAIPELQRLYQLAQSQKGQMDALFDANTLCSPSKLKQMVLGPAKALVTPNYQGNFFLAHTLVASAGYYLGIQSGLTLAHDFKMVSGVPTLRAVGLFGWVGPQMVTNVTVGISRGIQFYPVTTLDGFAGLGWGLGASVGVPTLKVVGAGVDVSFGTSLLPTGFGASLGVGAGILPADVSIAATYSWPIWTTQDLTADVVKFASGVVAGK
jgi:hypothetical protein